MTVLILTLAIVVARADAAEEEAPAAAAGAAETPAASNEPPSWMSADVIAAAIAINMTDAQLHQFNRFVSEYVTSHMAMVKKEVKREAPDLDQRIRSRDTALVHQLDDRVRPILTNEQWRAYEAYKKSLRSQLMAGGVPSSSNWTRAQPGIGGGQG
jgi:hypothetical protein